VRWLVHSRIHMAWLVHTCDVHWRRGQQLGHFHSGDMPRSHVWHDSFIHVKLHAHTRDMSRSYVWAPKSATSITDWQRPIGFHIFTGRFPQKSPIISGSFAKNDLQLQASYGSSQPCTCMFSLIHIWISHVTPLNASRQTWHDSSTRVIWLIHTCFVICAHTWLDSFMCVTNTIDGNINTS